MLQIRGVAFRLCICCLFSYLSYRYFEWIKQGYGGIGIMLSLPGWGVLLAPTLLDFFPWFKRSAEASVLEKWHGKYYVFDGHQLRFYLIDGVIWVPYRDVQSLIRPAISERELRLLGQDYARITGQALAAFSEAGLLRLLASRTADRHAKPQMIRFKRWLETQALPNVKRLPTSALL